MAKLLLKAAILVLTASFIVSSLCCSNTNEIIIAHSSDVRGFLEECG
jgi:hypothetical protein